MKKDIQNIDDVKLLVDTFYSVILKDKTLGYIFQDHMTTELEKHLPVMYQFWESLLLDNMTYRGNPMISHIKLNQRTPLTREHFDTWTNMWSETIDKLFDGPTSKMAKDKAVSMKELMLYKIEQSKNKGFIQ